MRDEIALFIILWLIYLVELAVWVPEGTVLFSLTKRSGARRSRAWIGNALGCFHLNHWFPARQLVGFAHQPLLAVSPEFVSNRRIQHWNRPRPNPQKSRCLAFTDIESVEISESQLLINGRIFVNCRTEEAARRLRDWIKELREMQRDQRETVIRTAYAARFVAESEIHTRLDQLRSATRRHRVLVSALFLHAFVAFPITYYLYPSPWVLLSFLLSSVLFGWVLCFLFHRLHKTLHPLESHRRFQAVLKQLLCFPISAAAIKDLSLPITADFEPLSVGKALLSTEDFRDFARSVWLDLKYPYYADVDPAVAHTRLELKTLTADYLLLHGIEPASLEAPLADWQTASVGYCPRCHAEFTQARSHCSDCPEVATVSLVCSK